MSGSKVVAMAGGFFALLAAGASNAAPQQACSLGSEYPIVSVSPYKRQAETGGYGGTVNRVLRGADIRVAAQPGLTAEWLERKLEGEIAAGYCQFGAGNVSVDVIPEEVSLVVRVTSGDEIGMVNRPTAADSTGAADILRRAQELPTR